jgi:hypothetical protein
VEYRGDSKLCTRETHYKKGMTWANPGRFIQRTKAQNVLSIEQPTTQVVYMLLALGSLIEIYVTIHTSFQKYKDLISSNHKSESELKKKKKIPSLFHQASMFILLFCRKEKVPLDPFCFLPIEKRQKNKKIKKKISFFVVGLNVVKVERVLEQVKG